MGAPVDDAAALVNEPLVIQFAERLPDGTGAALVHSKARAVPVTGGTHLLLLLYNAVAVLLLPGPYALQELLPAQVIAGQALLTQVFLHLDLGGDSGVVRTGQPQGLISLHPLEANKNILQHGICPAAIHISKIFFTPHTFSVAAVIVNHTYIFPFCHIFHKRKITFLIFTHPMNNLNNAFVFLITSQFRHHRQTGNFQSVCF